MPDYLIVERDENGVVQGDFEEHEEYIMLNGTSALLSPSHTRRQIRKTVCGKAC